MMLRRCFSSRSRSHLLRSPAVRGQLNLSDNRFRFSGVRTASDAVAAANQSFKSFEDIREICQQLINDGRQRFPGKVDEYELGKWECYELWYDKLFFDKRGDLEEKAFKLTSPISKKNWVEFKQLFNLLKAVDDIGLRRSSNYASMLLTSPTPVKTKIFEGDGYAMNLISVPGGGTGVFTPQHDLGTVLVYKPLLGEGVFETIADSGRAPLHSANIGMDGINTLSSPAFLRYGGKNRILKSSTSKPCILLEVSLQPPSTLGPQVASPAISQHVIYTVSTIAKASAVPELTCAGVITTADQAMVLQPPAAVIEDEIFDSEKYLIENAPRHIVVADEPAATTTTSLNARKKVKYDILNTISRRVGGLSDELGDIVRRVLSSRQLSPQVLKALGLSHVKGVLLYGPPGTGKTLIAREMAKALNSREPILVNGPEIMDKYVGESEKKIREIFGAAEKEWTDKGRDSELHVIIFDEFDAIAKRRGGPLSDGGSGVRDSCVNQLLTKLDGVEEMNNVLVVALTNRKDLIDPALLRPGRLEVHMEIRAPDLQGREEILFMLFKSLVRGGFVSPSDAKAWSLLLAQRSFGWTGAELSGLMRSAASFAIERSLASTLSNSLQLNWEDVDKALRETAKTIQVSKRAAFRSFLRSGAEKLRLIRSASNSRSNNGNSYIKRKRREFEEILAEDDDWSNPWEEKQPPLRNEKESGTMNNNITDDENSNSSNENRSASPPTGYGNIGGTIMF